MRKTYAYINMKEKKIIMIYFAVVTTLVIGAFFLFKARGQLLIGTISGSIIVTINLWMLKSIVNLFMEKPILAISLNLVRYLIYGIVVFLCYKLSITTVLGLCIAVIALPLTVIIFYSKGGTNDRC